MPINQRNVGRIAERIVSNELEFRGFRVSDLNKEGNSANADLLAAKDGRTWQIQVKGATEDGAFWFGYGHCTQDIVDGRRPVFNAASSFYKAQIVVLVCVRSPSEYQSLVLPIAIAERAAQINLDYAFRIPKRDGTPKAPNKMWVWSGRIPKTKDARKIPLYKAEQDLVMPYLSKWEIDNPAVFPEADCEVQ